jgi:hypothetical protein
MSRVTGRAFVVRPLPEGAARCRRKFLKHFPKGFRSPKYLAWERDYKWAAHEEWRRQLSQLEMRRLIDAGEFREIALRAVRIEAKTNLLFSFEKMALRDAVKTDQGSRDFARGLCDLAYGRENHQERFEAFGAVLDALPRKQTRVHTWPLHTVFGFIARPERDIFLKPNVTRNAAEAYGFDFHYESKPSWQTYSSILDFASRIADDMPDLEPRDLIDIQSFIWVLGSSEYD